MKLGKKGIAVNTRLLFGLVIGLAFFLPIVFIIVKMTAGTAAASTHSSFNDLRDAVFELRKSGTKESSTVSLLLDKKDVVLIFPAKSNEVSFTTRNSKSSKAGKKYTFTRPLICADKGCICACGEYSEENGKYTCHQPSCSAYEFPLEGGCAIVTDKQSGDSTGLECNGGAAIVRSIDGVFPDRTRSVWVEKHISDGVTGVRVCEHPPCLGNQKIEVS